MKPGDRVQIHPACDLWMRGARFGVVVKLGRGGHVWVLLDKLPKPRRFRLADILEVF